MNALRNCDPSLYYTADKQLKHEDVQILQQWLQKNAHLPKLTDSEVAIFLHSCYYSIETAKKTIDIYFTRRSLYDYFGRLNEEDLRRASSVALITVLPKRTDDNNVIFFARLMDTRVENFNFVKLFKLLEMVSILGVYTESPMNGIVIFFDCKGFGLGHVTRVNLMVLKHTLSHLQEGAPVRIKEIHFVNAYSAIDKLVGLAKPFLSNELYQMVQFHSSIDTFYKHVPQKCLPNDYGGSLPSCQILQEQTLSKLLKNYDLFKEYDDMKVDESKRVEKSHIFGIEGTFKKLEID